MTVKVRESFLEPFRAYSRRPQAGVELYQRAAEDGVTFSTWLNDHARETGLFKYDAGGHLRSEMGLDPYEELLRECNIRVGGDPKAGMYSDTMERFFASDQPYSLLLFPEFINRTLRAPLIQADILDELIAAYTPVDANAYRSIYLDIPSPFQGDVSYRQMARVAELAEIPKTRIKTKEQVVQLYKYGRTLEISYEAMRRIQIDLFTVLLSQIALQSMLDKAGSALDVAINGDGNGNPALNYNLTTLDPKTTPGTLSYAAWLQYQLAFYPYDVTTVIGNATAIVSLLTMAVPGLNAQNVFTLLRPGPVNDSLDLPQGLFNRTRLIYLPSTPANVLVGIDKRFSLEQINEIGGTMTETNKWINMQFEEIAVSEVVGHGKILTDAVRVLTLNA